MIELAVIVVIVGLPFMLAVIAVAPKGYEDQKGFHYGEPKR